MEKKAYCTWNGWFDLLYDVFLKHLSFWRETSEILLKMYIIKNVYFLYVKYPLFLSDFNETWIFSADFRTVLIFFMLSTRYSCRILTKREFSRQIFERYSNTKFHENTSSGFRVVPCRRTDTNTHTLRQTVQTKLSVAFRNFTNATKTGIIQFW